MKRLSESTEPVERKLSPEMAKSAQIERLELDEKKFRCLVNDNAMATEKTAEGIRKFAADVVKLEKLVGEFEKGDAATRAKIDRELTQLLFELD